MRADNSGYDPFAIGPLAVAISTIEVRDAVRGRVFPCEIWVPGGVDGKLPLLVFSHSAGQGRRSATFLCSHLASHGYAVAALDHSEVIAPELARRDGETEEEKSRRWDRVIASRVPDVRCLLDHLLHGSTLPDIEEKAVGLVGHSFGGWTVLAVPEVDPRVSAIVALAPAGASRPRPGILPVTLTFQWRWTIPTLFVVAENDTSLPLAGMVEMFERAPEPKLMVTLARADHMHFMDDVERKHEAVRTMTVSAELAELQKEMRPIGELLSGDQAQLAVRGLTLAHMDAALRGDPAARRLLSGDVGAALAGRGIDVSVRPGRNETEPEGDGW